MEYTHWWGPHSHWFWIIPFLFMVLMVFIAIRMARRASWRSGCGCLGRGRYGWWKPGQHSMAYQWSETPGQILDRRYASGEVTKEQHEQMKRYIESSLQHSGPGDGVTRD